MIERPRIRITPSDISCGIYQLSEMAECPDVDVLFSIGTSLYHPSRGIPCAVFVYSNTYDHQRSAQFFHEVTKRGFGKVTFTHSVLNPKTGHYIFLAVWVIDHEAFKVWWANEKLRLETKWNEAFKRLTP